MASEAKVTVTPNDKEGYLYLHQEEKKSLKKFFCVCLKMERHCVDIERKYIHIWKQSAR